MSSAGGISESESVDSDTVVLKRRRIRKGKNALIDEHDASEGPAAKRVAGGDSSQTSSSSESEDRKDESSEDASSSDLSDREILRRERIAEKRRRKDPVRKRYVAEAASDEDESDGDDDDNDDDDDDDGDGDGNECDGDELPAEGQRDGRTASASSDENTDVCHRSGGREHGHSAKRRKRNKKYANEDLSHVSLFASIREVEAMQGHCGVHSDRSEEDGSSGEDDGDNDSLLLSDNQGDEDQIDDLVDGEDGAAAEDASTESAGDNARECSENGSGFEEDQDEEQEEEEEEEEEQELQREKIRIKQMLQDPDCCHNMSKSLRIVPGIDVQVDPRYDGYVYFFTAEMEGAALPQDTLKQVLVLLHVIHSFIPEECILETEYLKPIFDKQGGLEKLQKRVELTEEEARKEEELRQKLSSLPISEMPFDVPFVASTSAGSADLDDDMASGEEAAGRSRHASSSVLEGLQGSLMLKRHYKMEIVDVAEILLAPVFITYTAPEDGSRQKRLDHADSLLSAAAQDDAPGAAAQASSGGSERKVTAFMLTMLKTRKCYNFSAHLQWLVNSVDKEVGSIITCILRCL
jgi:hypothetical protein